MAWLEMWTRKSGQLMAGEISYNMDETERPNVQRRKGDSFSLELNSEIATENHLQKIYQALMLITLTPRW